MRGRIQVRARILESSGTDLLLRIEVEDSGVGIAANDQDRLFGAYEQLDASTTRRYGGSGLGLAINRRLAEPDQLLAHDDVEANRLFARIAATLRLALGEEIMVLGQLIDAYDYSAALARVRTLRARH